VLRDHPIFRLPITIDRGQLIRRPWPDAWHDPHDGDEISVLPLVPLEFKPAMPGWCTYVQEMAEAPEVEVLSGGINTKTSTAAALWRQGNLLHYGFDLSPAEMNEWGRAMLINAICYIARFTEDRPIMETPSPFAGNEFLPRSTIERIIKRNDAAWWDYLATNFDRPTLDAARVKDLATFARWYTTVRDYLAPNGKGLMIVDRDAQDAQLSPGGRDFFDRVVVRLARAGAEGEGARRMLERYAPEGPGRGATAEDWNAWWKANADYLFFGEIGGYRWYLDPLAKARGVPSARLRGEARASR
jgi:hypothetical protein